MSERERWATRIGLILAAAGNAVGLGNFLRFPVQAAQNGGGAFMIPYFIAFLLLGIPLMWVEWSIGRYGGKYHHGHLPGMFDAIWRNPLAKYIGVLGIFVSSIIMIYYCYIESWTLAFSFFSLGKTYFGLTEFESMTGFLRSYQGVESGFFTSILPAYFFLLITLGVNFYILKRGISKGIELLAKFGMPLLIIMAIVLAIRVITLGTPDPINYPDRSVENGFAFIWNPNFSKLGDAKIWLAAAGQIFFTLSVGMGTLQAYASYLKEKDDIALNGLSTASTNEFVEVILGGSIAIPVAVAFFGLTATTEIASGGAFNLGFVSMPLIFQKLPLGEFFGFLWFFLLFIAGITSSVAMVQPLIAFLKEQFKISHNKATLYVAIGTFVSSHLVVAFFKFGFLDELDYWAGTFFLVLIGFLEVVIFAWIWGMDKGWIEINKGADIKIPKFFYYVIKYVTPLYILTILVYWGLTDAIPTLLMDNIPDEQIPYRWGARAFMFIVFAGLCFMVYKAWKLNKPRYDL
ncbi:MAG: sodium-dependent transporter [Ignavibacteria bacterium]|nr:sodium-dependent transporter [Ignavibacteria bacterium]